MKLITVDTERYDTICRAAVEIVLAHNEQLKAITLINLGCFEEAREVLKRSVRKTDLYAHAITGLVNGRLAREKAS